MPNPIARHHALILCDLWGCLHDGVRAFPGAVRALEELRQSGRMVILLTNAPRPSNRVRIQLDRLGVPPSSYDAIVSSGDIGIRALRAERRNIGGFIGSDQDREALLEQGVSIDESDESGVVVLTGFEGLASPSGLKTLEPRLRGLAEADREIWCLNPDLVVHRGGVEEPCAGAIAARYLELGGRVRFFGKPYSDVYAACLEHGSTTLGRVVGLDEVLAIGDGALTDLAGAARAGIDFLFVTGGIERDAIARLGMSRYLDGIKRNLDLPDLSLAGTVERLSDLTSASHSTAGGYPN